ncbi:MAG: pilus assembly protein [Chloroflexi bacterium]|nr:MAG: pilus assembly protein [Chloroflexota bacterium]
MSGIKVPEGRMGARRRKQRGQSLVEFAISSTVLLLLAMGLIDLSRAFYFSVAMQGAAREGARHAAWFSTNMRANNFLQDSEIRDTVKQALSGAGFSTSQVTFIGTNGCLTPSDSNSAGDKPYPASAYPSTPQTVNVYACYTTPAGAQYGTLASAPLDNSWRLGDINVMLLMNFQLITPFIQGIFGNSIDIAYNEHFTIQGKP